MQGGPLMQVIAAKAVCFLEAMQPGFTDYQKKVLENAKALAAGLQHNGLRLISGGTDNHLVLVDLTGSGVTGKQAEETLGKVGIIINRNAIPFDPNPPRITSGMRLGTPAVSSRGLGTAEMEKIAALVIGHIDDEAVQKKAAKEVAAICARFPVPGIDD
jgi:glycine hydroxymethyltransferase